MSTCPYCTLDLPLTVTHCPHCHSLLRGAERWRQHPLTIMLFMGLLMTSIALALNPIYRGFTSDTFTRSRVSAAAVADAAALMVVDSRVRFSQHDDIPAVVVTGTLRNTSAVTFLDPMIYIEFRNAAGQVSDVEERRAQGKAIPPGGTVAFRSTLRRQFDTDQYASHRVRIMAVRRD